MPDAEQGLEVSRAVMADDADPRAVAAAKPVTQVTGNVADCGRELPVRCINLPPDGKCRPVGYGDAVAPDPGCEVHLLANLPLLNCPSAPPMIALDEPADHKRALRYNPPLPYRGLHASIADAGLL